MRSFKGFTEARSARDASGYIDMDDDATKATPQNPMIIINGIGRMSYEGLKKDVARKLQQLAKRDDYTFLYKQIGKLEDFSDSGESVLQAYVRTLIQVEKQMSTGAYKRRINMAKRSR